MKNITRIGKIYLKISIVELDSRLRGNDTRGAGMAEQAGLAQEGWEWRTGQLISDKDYL